MNNKIKFTIKFDHDKFEFLESINTKWKEIFDKISYLYKDKNKILAYNEKFRNISSDITLSELQIHDG